MKRKFDGARGEDWSRGGWVKRSLVMAADAGHGKIESRRRIQVNKCRQAQEMMTCVCTCSNSQRGWRYFFQALKTRKNGNGAVPISIQKICLSSRGSLQYCMHRPHWPAVLDMNLFLERSLKAEKINLALYYIFHNFPLRSNLSFRLLQDKAL